MHPDIEQLFQLSSLFWLDSNSTTSINPVQLLLVYFLGVLGIQQKTFSFCTAYYYTPFLAGLVWVGQLLLLEYTLPLSPYQSLAWQAASTYPDQLERLQYIRRKYMYQGSVYPIGYLLDTLCFGRAQVFKHGPCTNISWSLNQQSLQLKTQFLKLYNFRSMVWVVIQEAQQAEQALLLGWKPAVNLYAVQDSLVNNQAGWSFLKEPDNQLQYSFQYLQEQAFRSKSQGFVKNQCWVPARAKAYLQDVARFKSLLLLCIYFTGGMPGRGTEVGTIK